MNSVMAFLRRRSTIVGVALVVVALGTAFAVLKSFAPAQAALVTTPVQQGTLVRTITSSGTINPQNTTSVGSQISGTISEVDVDYNSVVKTGQVLARIDPTLFQAALDQSTAQLTQTQAISRQGTANALAATAGVGVQRATAEAAAHNVASAQANAEAQAGAIVAAQSNIAKAQSALGLARVTMTRDTLLLGQGYIAQSAVDADRSTFETAQSGLTGAQSALTQARSQAVASVQQTNQAVDQSRSQTQQTAVSGAQAAASAGGAAAQAAAIGVQIAQVRTAKYNLAHTTITSPVNGTVIVRNVSLGQTVAASFSTPVLFTIAQDLSKMEVDLAVGEPDIGSVKTGATVTFTVLAYPDTFTGRVSQVRQNPTVVSNVVTYDTVVIVDNKRGLLRPGMTANALVQTQAARDALIVPLAALDWRPAAATSARYHIPAVSASARPRAAGSPRAAGGSQFGATQGAGATSLASGSRGRVWVLRATTLFAVPVQIVLTASSQAAVKPLDVALAPGDAVVTGDGSAVPAARSTTQQSAPGFGAPQGGGAPRGVR